METTKIYDVLKLTGNKNRSLESRLLVVEKELPIYINGEHLATASVTPAMEREFVIGYLFSQGFIDQTEEILALEITNKGAYAIIENTSLKQNAKINKSYRIVSGGGLTAYLETNLLPKIYSDLSLSRKSVFSALNILFENAFLYNMTGGVHSAALFRPDINLLCMVEDIGRHNTLDKIIGYALLNKIDCSKTFIVSTGRMTSEMVNKICRAGIPIVATKTAVTDKGLEIGQTCGLTIIGFVRNRGTKLHTDMEVRVFDKAEMRIYTRAERIL